MSSTGKVTFPIERRSQIDVLAVSIVFIILPTLAVILRFFAKRIAHRGIDASDYCIAAACACANGLQALAIVGIFECGVGFHFQEILEQYGLGPVTKFLKILIPVQILWAVSLSLCKISILLMYTRIFTMRLMVFVASATAVFIGAWALATILSGFFICRPFALNWDQTLEGSCGNQVLSYTITGSLNLVTDVVVFVLPIPYLWRLQLRLYKKLALLCTFGLGLFTIIISTMRLISLQELDYTDITFNIPHALIFGALEPSVGVTLACIPLLRPLLGRSKYSNNGTVESSISYVTSGNELRGVNAVQKQGFKQLDDDSSQFQLRPLGVKHSTSVSRGNEGIRDGGSDSDENILVENRQGNDIAVTTQWKVDHS